MPVTVIDIDLHQADRDIVVEGPYGSASALVRWRGRPLGQVNLPVVQHQIPLTSIWQASSNAFGDLLRSCVAESVLFGGHSPDCLASPDICPCTVIICTRDRSKDLKRCLQALLSSRPRAAEIIVVDNAPPDYATVRVASMFPVKYVVEPRKGLNWARSCGARAATSELLLYTDDDVAVDPGWIGAMCKPFSDPQVAAVTGLVLALELETPTQEAFERYIGFSRGFKEYRFSRSNLPPPAAGNVGAGASMAFRKSLVESLRLFDVELDCGTAAFSGGDNYAFYRLLKDGFAIFYTPEAICWHRHRRTEPELLATLYGYSVGVFCMLFRCIEDHRDWAALRVGFGWFIGHHLKNLIRGLLRRPGVVPLRYTACEISGAIAAYPAYRKTRRMEGHPGGKDSARDKCV